MAHSSMIRRLAALCVPLLVLLAAFSPVGAQTDFLTDLVACWNLDEESGTRMDFWNNDLDLTDNNTVGSTAGYVNTTAALFARSNSEYLSHVDDDTLDLSGDRTFYIWVDPGTWPNTLMVWAAKFTNATNREFSFGVQSTKKPIIGLSGDGTNWYSIVATNAMSGTWQSVIAWYDSSGPTVNITVDNGATDSAAGPAAPYAGNSDLLIGRRIDNANFYYDGSMGPLAIWDRVLTAEERSTLWNGGAGYSCSDITGLQAGQTYAIQQISLPSGVTGAVELRMSAGEIGIISGTLFIAILALYYLMSRRAIETRAATKK